MQEQNIVQVNSTWGIDINALMHVMVIGKSLSKIELFTKYDVMIKDGIPYTGDKKGNVGTNTMNNFMSWLPQAVNYIMQGNNILIQSLKSTSTIIHKTKNLLYKPYVETLFYDLLNREYNAFFIQQPPHIMTMNLDYTLLNDYLTQEFDIMGDMYNILTTSYYSDNLKRYFFDNYEINYYPFYGFIMKCLRNATITNIDNTIEKANIDGINKKQLYTVNKNPLTDIQTQFILQNYIMPIRSNDIASGINYRHDLTGEINRRLKINFKDKTKRIVLSNVFQIQDYMPICKTWYIQIERAYKIQSLKLPIDFSKRIMNDNAIQKIQDISGYSTIIQHYNSKSKEFIVSPQLKQYTRQFPFSPQYLSFYMSDLDTMMKDIG